jgi:hypothetical protein
MIAMAKRIRNYALGTLLLSFSAIFLSGQVNGDTIAPRYRSLVIGEPYAPDLVFTDVTTAYPASVFSESGMKGIIKKGEYTLRKPYHYPGSDRYDGYSLTKIGSDQNLLGNIDLGSTSIRAFNSSGQVIGSDIVDNEGERTQMNFLLDPMTGIKKYFDSSFYPTSLNKDGVIIGMWNKAPAIMQSFDSDPELLLPLIENSSDLAGVWLHDINDFGVIASMGYSNSYRAGHSPNVNVAIWIIPLAPAPVPEPSTFVVIGSGLVLAWIRRQRIARNQESNE